MPIAHRRAALSYLCDTLEVPALRELNEGSPIILLLTPFFPRALSHYRARRNLLTVSTFIPRADDNETAVFRRGGARADTRARDLISVISYSRRLFSNERR